MFVGSKAPYGYKKDPNNKNKLLIDKEAAEVVKLIFDLVVEGNGYEYIKHVLLEKKYPNPMTYFNRKNPNYYKKDYWRQEYDWHANSIRVIVENPVHYGALAYGKTRVIKVGSKKARRVPKEDWIIVEDCHEPIVDKETWKLAQRMKRKYSARTKSGRINPFKGILKCSTCGSGLSMNSTSEGRFKSYGCWVYKNHRDRCTPHNISFKTIYKIVLEDIKKNALIAMLSQDRLIKVLSEEDNERKHKSINKMNNEIKLKQNRLQEIDIILSKMYEDHALGKLSETRYFSMEDTLINERNNIKIELDDIEEKLKNLTNTLNNAENYVEMIQKYVSLEKLDARVVNQLIDKIVVYEKIKDKMGKVSQLVEIHYRFINNIDTNKLISDLSKAT